MELALKHQLNGKTLRWVVCLLLRDARKALSVAEIVALVEAESYTIPGARPGKTVSDALRWEVGRGRVAQVRRGLYSAGLMQRSTEYSMRQRVEALRSTQKVSLVATTAALSDVATNSALPAPDAYGPGELDLDAVCISDEPSLAAWSFDAGAFED